MMIASSLVTMEDVLQGAPCTTDDEISPAATQLMTLATFNGLCHLITSLSRNGLLSPFQLARIHEAMITPLDDPDWRDYEFVASTRDAVDSVLAQAAKHAKEI